MAISNRNKMLKILSEIHNIIFLDRESLICSNKLKECDFFDENNNKIQYDGAHLTHEGSEYLAEKINSLNWFNVD